MPEEASIVAVSPVDVVGTLPSDVLPAACHRFRLISIWFLDIADHFGTRSVGTNPKHRCTRFGSEWRDLE